jgi:hypothetical protein
MSKMAKATASERNALRALSARREEIIANLPNHPELLQELAAVNRELGRVRGEYSAKAKPFFATIAPLRKVLSFYDKVVIPEGLKALGYTLEPIEVVDPEDAEKVAKTTKA